jgi:hypothetical protein
MGLVRVETMQRLIEAWRDGRRASGDRELAGIDTAADLQRLEDHL